MSGVRRGITCALQLLGGLAVLAASGAQAAEWSGSASLFLREEYNDNILMTAAPHDPVWGSTASSLLTLGMRDERLQVKAAALTEYTHYAGEQGLDTTIYDLTLSPVYAMGRATWGLDGEMKQDLTLGGELAETGVVLTRSRRRSGNISPVLTWSLTERASLQWRYRYTRVIYPGGEPGLVDYELHEASMTGMVSPTERDTVTAMVHYTGYRAAGIDFLSRDYAAQIGLTRHLSELTTGSVSVGGHQTTAASGPAPTDRRWGWLLEGNAERRSEVTLLTGGVSHEVLPSGGGYLLQVTHLSGLIHRDLFQSLGAFVSADAYWSAALRADITVPDNRYHTVTTGLSWTWRDHWSVEASYRYDRQDEPSSVTANVVYLKAAFNGDTVISTP